MLTVTHLTKSYGKHTVLTDISLQAKTGQYIGIVGTNGCGKSTLLSILAGARRPDNGSISYDGKDLLKHPKEIASYIGYVPQENPLIPELSARDNLKLWYCDSPLNMEQELSKGVLHMLGIDEFLDTTVLKLSGGMKKRLSIGCAVALNPPILILDEPGAALDFVCKENIRFYLKNYISNRGTVIIATHEESELSLCDTLYVLKNGTLSEISPSLRGSQLLSHL